MINSIKIYTPLVLEPGIMYNLPEIHKQNIPLRPITSSILVLFYTKQLNIYQKFLVY